MNWTDEEIEIELKHIALIAGDHDLEDESRSIRRFRSALLELKRVRAWVEYGLSKDAETVRAYTDILCSIQDGDPAPTEGPK